MKNEDYANARTLATVEHFGEEFRVVRRKLNGKPWRKYLALVHGNTYVAALDDGCTDAKQAARVFTDKLRKCFESRAALLASLTPILEKNKPTEERP